MDNIKIIFFDIDGTLIGLNQGRPTDKVLEALKRLQNSGVRICLATGRSPVQLPVFPGVEFDAYMTFNGSYCFDKKGVISSRPLKREDVATIIGNASAMGRPVAMALVDRIAANGADEDLRQYFDFSGHKVPIAEDFEEAAREEDVYQIMVSCRREEYESLLSGAHNAQITAWWDRAVDIIPRGGGKGAGVEEILRHFGLSRQESMAFGDGNNDLELLSAVGWGVAMGNASPELKAAADDVCGHVSDDGVYTYCVSHNLI